MDRRDRQQEERPVPIAGIAEQRGTSLFTRHTRAVARRGCGVLVETPKAKEAHHGP